MSSDERSLRKMFVKCAVPGCKSDSITTPNMRFHQFPDSNKRTVFNPDYFGNLRKVDQLVAWLTNVRLKLGDISRTSRVCSMHFTKNDYYFPEYTSQRLTLKRNAVPSVNLSKEVSERLRKSEARLQRRLNRDRVNKPDSIAPQVQISRALFNTGIRQQNYELVINYGDDHNYCRTEKSVSINSVIRIDFTNPHDNVLRVNNAINMLPINPIFMALQPAIVTEPTIIVEPISMVEPTNPAVMEPTNPIAEEPVQCVIRTQQDFGLQVDQRYQFFDVIKTDKQLHSATGIKSLETLDRIVEKMNAVTENRYEKNTVIMTTKKRVIMTFVKLKHDVSYTFLAGILDSVTQLTCRRVFIDTVKFLNKYLDELDIPWPSDLKSMFEKIIFTADSPKKRDDGVTENEKDNT